MSEKKIENEYTYIGLGFPVVLRNVPMIELRGVWTPDIDLNFLQKAVLLGLAHQSNDLTGSQIRFIRLWMGLNQTEFGHQLGVTHPAVVKWEKAKDKGAKIILTTQRDLRLLLLDKLLSKDEDFRNAFRVIHEKEFSGKIHPLDLDVSTDLVAI